MQAVYECGGRQLLAVPHPSEVDDMLRLVVDMVTGCAGEITRPDSEFGARFEALLQQTIRTNSDLAGAALVRADRLVHQLARAFAALRVFDLTFYLSDQLADTLVDPLTLFIRGDGQPQQLGVWQPACENLVTDANRLYRNLALQDAFSDTTRDLWQFSQWQPSARVAVQPLDTCADTYMIDLADFLPDSWPHEFMGSVSDG